MIAPGDPKKQAERQLRWHNLAHRLLGECACQPEFTSRDILDPDCLWHQNRNALIEALNAEYMQGRADQRYEWMGRIQGRHGD